jgi:hypothetical protein
MKYTVITSFHQEGLNQYGQRMVNSFERHWPDDVNLIVCAENCQPKIARPTTKVYDLMDVSANCRAFVERHRTNPLAHGQAGPGDVWNPKKAFRWNAVRFAYKVFSVALCANNISSGWMIWIDADTHTHSTVTKSWLDEVCPESAMISYLGRGEKYHSECGWVAYNLDHPETRNFIADFVGMYNTDSIFNEREWHDSYIWDLVRKKYQDQNVFYNLNPSYADKGLAGHPFINSKLGECMDHVKGDRKTYGHSKAKEVVSHRDHPYWQRVLAGPKVNFNITDKDE